MKGVRETDKAYVLGLSNCVKGVLFIKTVLEAWIRNRCAEVEKEGREDVLRIQSFILSTLISCCLFAVQMETSVRALDAGICCCTVVVKSTVCGARA